MSAAQMNPSTVTGKKIIKITGEKETQIEREDIIVKRRKLKVIWFKGITF